eukprot:Nk52_evm31s1073 gene=Nk52_evmTU31s1073
MSEGVLVSLDMSEGVLVSLDMSEGVLVSLDMSEGVLVSLDMSEGVLVSLDMSEGVLVSLDMSEGVLVSLDMSEGVLVSLDMSEEVLVSLDMSEGVLVSLDMSEGVLVSLDMSEGVLVSLDMSEEVLVSLDMSEGVLVSLDMSEGVLVSLDMSEGVLVSLDMSEGSHGGSSSMVWWWSTNMRICNKCEGKVEGFHLKLNDNRFCSGYTFLNHKRKRQGESMAVSPNMGYSDPARVVNAANASFGPGADCEFDGVVLVIESAKDLSRFEEAKKLLEFLQQLEKLDKELFSEVKCLYPGFVHGSKLILSPTGKLNRDYDDVRRYQDAARAGIERAVTSGCVKPLVVMCDVVYGQGNAFLDGLFERCFEVVVLGCFNGLYEPVEFREHAPKECEPVKSFGIKRLGACEMKDSVEKAIENCYAIEAGKRVARDVCGSDPERMAPMRVVEYLEGAFKGFSNIKMSVESNLETLETNYPLLHAVARCSNVVERHRPCLINLEYCGEGPIEKTLMLVGKGIVYDTGGADVKCSGHMAGMCRDKGGAAGIAGFMKTVSMLKPKGLKVIAKLSMVRNSIGADSFVADELIKSRAGVRVMIGNTDAEGRLVMADPLCEMKELSANEVNPHLMTVATLTGHVCVALGSYAAVMSNGAARLLKTDQKIFEAGEKWADPFEISTLRREDFDFIKARSKYEDTRHCNNEPSSATARGHQFPAAFMMRASGLDKHGLDSDRPIAYSHLDIAGAALDFPENPSGTPVSALTAAYVL